MLKGQFVGLQYKKNLQIFAFWSFTFNTSDARLAVLLSLRTVHIVAGGAQSSIKQKEIFEKISNIQFWLCHRWHIALWDCIPFLFSVEAIVAILWRSRDCRWAANGAGLFSYTRLYSYAAVVMIFSVHNPAHRLKHCVFVTVFSLFLSSASPPWALTVLPTSIHLGVLSPQSDNRLYLDVLFWVVRCEHVCIYACMWAEKLLIHAHSNTNPVKPNLKSIELCTCSVLSAWRINAKLLSLIYTHWSPGLLGFFDWVLWPLVFKVWRWETIDHCTGNMTQF